MGTSHQGPPYEPEPDPPFGAAQAAAGSADGSPFDWPDSWFRPAPAASRSAGRRDAGSREERRRAAYDVPPRRSRPSPDPASRDPAARTVSGGQARPGPAARQGPKHRAGRNSGPPASRAPSHDLPPGGRETRRDLPPDGREPGQDPGYSQEPGRGDPGYSQEPGRGDPGYSQEPGRGDPGHGPGYSQPPQYRGRGYGPPERLAAGWQPIGVNPDYDTAQFPAIRQSPAAPPEGQPAAPSLVRSSGVMAIGTLASRLSGLVRTLVQSAALGAGLLSEAYNNANTLPNVVYNLVLGGILTSVIVPLLVNAANRYRGRSEAYDQRMFTLITFALLAVTVIATLAAAPIVLLYKGALSGPTVHLMIILAYFCIPQVFFYGVSSLAGAILNARGSFAAPMWTPIVNNIVVIAVLGMFMAVGGLHAGPSTISGGQVALLGIGTTIGIVAQTAALLPALRRVGFRWHPRFDFQRAEVAEIWRMAAWILAYIACTQVAFLVTTVVANTAGTWALHAHQPDRGITPYNYGWQLFQMPYAVVGISVITALLPRMSQHAAEGRLSLVRDDFSTGIRLSSAIVVPSALVLAALGPALGVLLLAHGRTSLHSGQYMGDVFALFCLGLLPYMYFQLQLRVFYSLHDSRTPAMIGLLTMIVNVAANLLALALLPAGSVVAGLGVGFGLANLAGAVQAARILLRRLGDMDGWHIRRSLVRMHAAAVPAAVLALFIAVSLDGHAHAGHADAAAAVILGGGAAGLAYVLLCKVFRVAELAELARTVTGRFHR